jgi:hypothetical protein
MSGVRLIVITVEIAENLINKNMNIQVKCNDKEAYCNIPMCGNCARVTGSNDGEVKCDKKPDWHDYQDWCFLYTNKNENKHENTRKKVRKDS